MGLTKYRKIRNFAKTPEPAGRPSGAKKTAGGKQPRRAFVVQQHHASHEHFDFRIEIDGTLKSWAVPKGPSLDPADKRLAVEVEDHPLEYGSFEGTIPEGQYGAGSVIVWDRGTWEPQGDENPAAAHRRGSLKLVLHGKKLKGGWALVRMAGREGESRRNWLLIKERDAYAKPRSTYDVVARAAKSVVSGKKIEEIGKDGAVWNSKRAARPRARKKTVKKRSRSRAAPEGPSPGQLAGAKPGSPHPSFRPELATLVDRVPAGDAWLHEMKFDGYRILAFMEDGKVRLVTRKGIDWSDRFPETRDAVEAIGATSGVLDGEVVALDERGLSHFQNLQGVLKNGRTGEVVYFVFDVPYWAGYDLTGCRLADRREFLRSLFALWGSDGSGRVRLSEEIKGQGDAVLQQACRLHLEGILSKHADSTYVSARTRDWVKVKCAHRQEFVIGGYTDPKGGRLGFGSLLIGHYKGPRLVYAGKVGAGFDAPGLAALGNQLEAMERKASPFDPPPRGPGQHWVAPRLVAEVGFTEWTSDGRLRHPVFLGLREDKEASEVTRETPRSPKPRAGKDGRARRASPAAKPETKAGGGTSRARSGKEEAVVAGVRITNPDRVVYPAQGLTKLQIAQYYETIADEILPLLTGRPLSLVRCPDGSTGECFFHKHIKIEPGSGLRPVDVVESGGKSVYAAVANLAGLIYLVQMNTLELHAWGSRADNIERPDRLVFDLDPGEESSWGLVVEAAIKLKGVFEELGLRSFVMTSGGKGLHVVIPIQRRVGWDDAKAFAKSVASALEQAKPDKYVANMSKAKRRGKVFIDYLRVQRGATSIVPYSTRARAGAPVAMPIEWDEVEDIKPDAFNVANTPDHVASRPRDPWDGLLKLRQSIPAAVMPRRTR